jgi:BTB/POZ domain
MIAFVRQSGCIYLPRSKLNVVITRWMVSAEPSSASSTTAAATKVEGSANGSNATAVSSSSAPKVETLLQGTNSINLGKIVRHGQGDACITLNVGGKEFYTLRSTVAANSVLADHVARAERNHEVMRNGAVFIDRDPEYFHYILTYLRNRVEYQTLKFSDKASLIKISKSYIELPSDSKILRELYVEAVFYRMPELQKALSESSVMVQMASVLSKTTGSVNPFDWLIRFWAQFRTLAIAGGAIGGGYIVAVQNEWNWMLQKVGLQKKDWRTKSAVFDD